MKTNTTQQWVSVKDRLPADDREVLVFDGAYFWLANFDGRYWARTDSADYNELEPTHWMQLHQPKL